ncbi:hypothetical protein QUG98_03070 [Curtobacterium sp. RHCJP20]|uniref:Secreted peptide n=1 Tax=Curtobacterium subtropicum TaxID=3055138 RepID=A0ABT7TCX9_9MICO|nr:hypothetical protein [Curtobacterium subtropicum]MDM7887427.1 hypothetical protein [Curtobacterium subtropicum]
MVVLLVLLWCWTVLVVRVALIVRVELIVLVWLVVPTAVGAGWSSGTTRPDG